jgi:multidrug efflux system membrane fusion protein
VQHGANNDFVYLLNSDQTVSVKPIVAGAVYGDNTVVTSGLTPGQSVVVEGADKLIDGSTVTVATSKSSTDIKTTSRSKWRFFA